MTAIAAPHSQCRSWVKSADLNGAVTLPVCPDQQTISEPNQTSPSGQFPTNARSKQVLYSITLSALASSVGGTSRPSALAVLRLIANSNLVGCCTGKSPGFAPLKILSMKAASWK